MHDSHAESIPPARDAAIAALAATQHGVVARRQLEALGVSRGAIAHRVQAGRLHRIHVGVYAVGHRVLGIRGHWMAAVLACGPAAALSHASAAALWEIRPTDAALIDVSVPRTGRRKRPRLRIHRPLALAGAEVTVRDGIPVTTPARTLLDLAATLRPRALERALDRAEVAELTDYPALGAIARAHPSHRGATKLRTALAGHLAGTTLTRSELEERFLELCDAHGIPRPAVNRRAAGFEVDFLFEAARLVVETDGWAYHRTRAAFERDRERDAALTRAGYRALRFSHEQVAHGAAELAATLRAALGAPFADAA